MKGVEFHSGCHMGKKMVSSEHLCEFDPLGSIAQNRISANRNDRFDAFCSETNESHHGPGRAGIFDGDPPLKM
jgi:hypothetical protein